MDKQSHEEFDHARADLIIHTEGTWKSSSRGDKARTFDPKTGRKFEPRYLGCYGKKGHMSA